MIEIIEKFGVPLLVGFIGAFFAARLAISKHRYEKVWEKRIDAYTDIINALHEMKRPRDRFYEAEIKGFELSEETREELWDRSRNARRKIEKAIDTSAFLISPTMGVILQEFESSMEKALNEEDDWLELITAEYAAVNKCLNSVKLVASSELKLNS